MKVNDNISVRRAARRDAAELAGILKMSFDVGDNQRVLGERGTVALFELIPKLENSILLIAEEENKVIGYIWMQFDEMSFAEYLRDAPLETLAVIAAVLKGFKFREIYRAVKSQKDTGFFCTPYPKIMSLAVKSEERRKGSGTALISMLDRCLQVKGISDYFVLTSVGNSEALSFYENNGFNRYKESQGQVIFRKSIGLKRD